MSELDDGPPYEPDDLRSLYEEEYPGGWAAYCRDQEKRDRAEKELLARSPWRRLEKRIEHLTHDAGIGTDLARKLVENRLAVEIAEAIAQEFRLEVDLITTWQKVSRGDSEAVKGRDDEPRVETPYLNVEQAASYLKKTTKAVYGLIERGKLKKMPGSRICYFTKEMLDDFLKGEAANGRCVRPGRRKKN